MPNVRGRRVRAGGAGVLGAGRARVLVPGTRGLRRVQGVRVARPVRVRLHLRHCRAAVLPPGVSARPRPGLATCICMHHQLDHHHYEFEKLSVASSTLGRLHWPDLVSVALFFF